MISASPLASLAATQFLQVSSVRCLRALGYGLGQPVCGCGCCRWAHRGIQYISGRTGTVPRGNKSGNSARYLEILFTFSARPESHG